MPTASPVDSRSSSPSGPEARAVPHHRTLAPPERRGGGAPVIHAELRRHYDKLYDQLLNGRPPRDARPVLDVGTGDGLALAAITQGSPLHGVGVDTAEPGHWLGPEGWSVIQADAQRLPFCEGSFRSALMVDVFEWLRHPTATLAEIARVTNGPILVVQTDWEGLWFQADKSAVGLRADRAEVGRDLVRAFTRGAPDQLRGRIRAASAEAGLELTSSSVATITTGELKPNNLAWDVLESIRRYLVIESAQVRARRFDDWRAELQRAADDGQFTMLLRRVVALLERGGS
ncbi:MAG: methyltransferase domain-containing protein [Chloroflexi bacterium]|nr:methyltransferase domain-containing protein [Chloroflexota bacterium]